MKNFLLNLRFTMPAIAGRSTPIKRLVTYDSVRLSLGVSLSTHSRPEENYQNVLCQNRRSRCPCRCKYLNYPYQITLY